MRRRLLVAFVLAASSAPVAPPAEASITRIVIDPARSESPAFEGRTFGPDGKVGPYESSGARPLAKSIPTTLATR